MVPLPVPEAGETVNHAAWSLADQLSVPPPVLLTLRAWVAGLAPPWVAAKAKLVGLAPKAGGTGAGGDDDDDGGLTSCVSPGISAVRRDIERPAAGVVAPLEEFVEGAPASEVDPSNELRGIVVLGLTAVLVVAVVVLISVSDDVAGAVTAPTLLETEVSLDCVVVSIRGALETVVEDVGLDASSGSGCSVAVRELCDF